LLIERLALGRVHWAGLSMGGMVGMRLALAHPQMIRSLTLMDTAARPERADQLEMSLQSIEVMRAHGPAAVSEAIMQIFFAPETFRAQPQLIAHYRTKFESYRQLDGIIAACQAVFAREDISEQIRNIIAPTLVIVGEDDVATLPAESQLIAHEIAGAQLAVIKQAGHMSATEKPAEVAALMRNFLTGIQ
jgi:3-oxoadipate enol-lactonase